MERSGEPGKERRMGQPSALRRVGEQAVSELRVEQQRPLIDPFTGAYHPPHDWQKNIVFQAGFDKAVATLFDKATYPVTRLHEDQANELRWLLGLPGILVGKDAKLGGPEKAKGYLRAAKQKYPGRLAHARDNPRVGAMSRVMDVFTLKRETTVDDVVELFGGNPQVPLLLKGAIAEVLRASIERAPYEREHGM